MTDPETPDDAYERLLRETRLGEQIGEWEEILAQTQVGPPKLGYLLSGTELMLLIGQLRELRARRIAMGREPDDEANAPADMCCCHDWPRPADYEPEPQFADGCPLHPRHRDCDGETAADGCRYLGGECEPDCPVLKHDVSKD